MEPENDPIEKENHLPNLHFGVPCFQGVMLADMLGTKFHETPLVGGEEDLEESEYLRCRKKVRKGCCLLDGYLSPELFES